MTYTPTRPIMGAAELASWHLASRGRDYTASDDGYGDMEQAAKNGWRSLASWGADGWDLGDWPYLTVQVMERAEGPRFLVQSICEGDHSIYAFETDGDRDAALDYLFLWYAAGKDWAPLSYNQRSQLDEGGFEVDPKFRGPYRTD
jgi:hypothetical protein